MNSSRTPNESPLSEETDQPEKNILLEIKRQVESFTSIGLRNSLIMGHEYQYYRESKMLKLKSWIRANFFKIDRRGQALPIYAHEIAPMRAFSVLQKRQKIAKMTPNDLLTLEMVFTKPLRNTEHILLVF